MGTASQRGEWVYRLLAWHERVLPRWLFVWLSHNMGPRRAARVVPHMRHSAIPKVMQHLRPEFSASVAPLLTNESIKLVVDHVTIEMLVEVARVLAKNGDYKSMAAFGTLMGPSRVKAFVVAFNDADSMAHAAQYFDSVTLARVVEAFSGRYFSRLAEALERLGYNKTEAEVGRVMTPDHLASLLRELKPAQAARFLAGADKERLERVLSKLPEQRRSALEQALIDAVTGQH